MAAAVGAAALAASAALAQAPTTWEPLGPGGGGALFSPSFSPHNSTELFMSCDMSELFHTTNLGQSWDMVHFLELQGNRLSKVQFTSDPDVLYSLDYTVVEGLDLRRPAKSLDGGATWTPLAGDPSGGEIYHVFADPQTTTRVLITDYSRLYVSNDGGTSFDERFSSNVNGAGLFIGGAFFDGDTIYLGTSAGLLVSTNGGASFALDGSANYPPDSAIASFAGAKEGGTTRLWALMAHPGDVYGGLFPEDLIGTLQRVFVLDVGSPGGWVERSTGLPLTAGNGRNFVGAAGNDIDTAWCSGGTNGFPSIHRTTDGGLNWTETFLAIDNQNITTGWSGDGGDRGWGYGEYTLGFAVHPTNANMAAYTDLGFVHLTTDGGASWRQAYVNQGDENPAGSDTPQGLSYRSIGLENTTAWNVTWADADNIWISQADIRGIRSTDGGDSWSFNYSGHTQNSSYDVVRHPNGTLYLAASTVHDIYQTTYIRDARLAGSGRVLFSTNNGQSWSVLRDFDDPVIDLELDPNNADVLYASVINPTSAAIWRTSNLSMGAASTWSPLAVPPSTENRPFNIKVLDDGALVCTYSGRRAGSPEAFTPSSGVFYSTNGGASWEARRHANMFYYVKDIVIDPNDSNQNTWYVGVWSGWGGPLATNNSAGGLYRTSDRGVNWERIFTAHRVSHCVVSPDDQNLLFVTTETEGLWMTSNLGDAQPTFTQVTSFPFRQPERVFFNPFDTAELWVTTFGHCAYRGRIPGLDGDGGDSWFVY